MLGVEIPCAPFGVVASGTTAVDAGEALVFHSAGVHWLQLGLTGQPDTGAVSVHVPSLTLHNRDGTVIAFSMRYELPE